MDLTKYTKTELLAKCATLGITKCKSKTKPELIQLIQANYVSEPVSEPAFDSSETIISELVLSSIKYKFIDLFCGIGGFHQALTVKGCECVFAADIDPHCRAIYERNYGLKPAGDITQVDENAIPAFDILCGGFPCQPFSKSGFQKGFEDTRGTLFFDICRIAKHHQPKYMILENVKNLTSHDDGKTWKVIYNAIIELGYQTYVEPVVLNVLHYNVPQNRERVVIMCKRADLGLLPPLPEIQKHPKLTLTVGIKDIICDENTPILNEYTLSGKMSDVNTVWNNFIQLLKQHQIQIPKYPIWTDWWDNDINEDSAFYEKYTGWIDKNRAFYQTHYTVLNPWLQQSRQCANWTGAVRKFEWQAGELLHDDSMSTIIWTARGSGIRVKRPNYIPTLVAMNMIPVYGPKRRKLIPRELLRLQSFPDNFVYDEKHIFKQVGNAVNVKMMEYVYQFLVEGKSLFP
jgi:DNA (cytosine-5)-methyltransferase 1